MADVKYLITWPNGRFRKRPPNAEEIARFEQNAAASLHVWDVNLRNGYEFLRDDIAEARQDYLDSVQALRDEFGLPTPPGFGEPTT